MIILKERPPNYDRIAKVFPAVLRTPQVVFCYGESIYAPGLEGPPESLSEALIAHETVHSDRQLETEGGPDAWWDRYLLEKDFRLEEELLAHTIEYQYLYNRTAHRNERRRWLQAISEKLASPIYGPMISQGYAKEYIKKLLKDITK